MICLLKENVLSLIAVGVEGKNIPRNNAIKVNFLSIAVQTVWRLYTALIWCLLAKLKGKSTKLTIFLSWNPADLHRERNCLKQYGIENVPAMVL